MVATCKPNDVELGHVRDGYPALAEWIARDVDGDTYMFRKFDRLAARNILHLQARLVALEYEIDQLDEQARQCKDPNVKLSSRRWETLMEQAKIPDGLEEARVQKLDELKVLLKEYCKSTLYHKLTQVLTRLDGTLVLQSDVAGLHKPRDKAISAFREYLKGTAYRDGTDKPMPLISGRAKAFLDKEDDLVSLAKPLEEDYFSRFLLNNWLFKKRKTSDPFDRTVIYKKAHVVQTVAALAMVLAAILLIGAIVNLYLVSEPKAKLGLVAMYTLFFAFSLALCTNAKRFEIFAATATYAAVLVGEFVYFEVRPD
jgi:hypothetical protein